MFEQIGIFQNCATTTPGDTHGPQSMPFSRAGRRVMLVYNEFRSVMTQRVVVDQPAADYARRRRRQRVAVAPTPRRRPARADRLLYEPSTSKSSRALHATSRPGLPRAARIARRFFAAQMTAMDTAQELAEMIAP